MRHEVNTVKQSKGDNSVFSLNGVSFLEIIFTGVIEVAFFFVFLSSVRNNNRRVCLLSVNCFVYIIKCIETVDFVLENSSQRLQF